MKWLFWQMVLNDLFEWKKETILYAFSLHWNTKKCHWLINKVNDTILQVQIHHLQIMSKNFLYIIIILASINLMENQASSFILRFCKTSMFAYQFASYTLYLYIIYCNYTKQIFQMSPTTGKSVLPSNLN